MQAAPITPPATQAMQARTWKAARDFEALAINELLKPMFDTISQPDPVFGGGKGEEAWKPMMVNELAKSIEHGGGLGLAAAVYAQMLRSQEGPRPAGGVGG